MNITQLSVSTSSKPNCENAEECSARISRMLQQLAEVDPELAVWDDLKYDKRIIPDDVAEIAKIVSRCRYRRDTDRSVMEEMGYNPAFVTLGRGANMATLKVKCGRYDTVTHLPNGVHFDFHVDSETGRRLSMLDKQHSILSILVDATDAEVGHVIPLGMSYVDIGWIAYVRHPVLSIPPLPTGARVVAGSGGSIVTLIKDPVLGDQPGYSELSAGVLNMFRTAHLWPW